MNRLEPEITPAFGLVAWLEQTKITLPLKGVECRFDVTAGVASVEIDQIFHQSHEQPLDCTYTFPLPSGAAVYRCEMHVNGRVIRAKVEAREDAKRIFVEQKAAGRRAALVETERDNLFTLSLGNLQPQDVVVIRFAYFQTLERIGAQQRLRVPVCPGVRYIPGKPLLRSLSGRGTADDTDQVPDASRLSPPRIDALHPDAAYFSAEGAVASADVAAGTLSSPTHRLLVHAAAENYDLALATGGAVPDRDLVIAWDEPQEAKLAPRAWTFSDEGETFALVQLRAPAEVGVSDSFEQDVYFLVDRSGSMAGDKWTKTCAALTGFVKVLGARDRVWITLFESSFLDFAEAPLPAPRVLRDQAFMRLVERGVAGGTEVLPAARHVLAKIAEHSADRPTTVIYITDGQVGNEDAILECFRGQPAVTVHVFGIDTAVNDAFLKRLARQHGGDCWLQTPNDDIAATVAGLGDRLRRPVLTQLVPSVGWEPSTSQLPNLHAGQVIDVALRCITSAPLEISGALGNGERYHFSLTPAPTANAAVKLLWARQRIESFVSKGRTAAALALAKQHNLLCEGAAFIAWDDAEKVMVAQREIIQPSLHPEVLYSRRPSIACCEVAPRSHDIQPRASRFIPMASMLEFDESVDKCSEGAPPPTEAEDYRAMLVRHGVDDEFARVLAEWADAKWLKRRARRLALQRLGRIFETCEFELATRVWICRQFIVQEVAGEPAVSARLLALVDAWERRVQV